MAIINAPAPEKATLQPQLETTPAVAAAEQDSLLHKYSGVLSSTHFPDFKRAIMEAIRNGDLTRAEKMIVSYADLIGHPIAGQAATVSVFGQNFLADKHEKWRELHHPQGVQVAEVPTSAQTFPNHIAPPKHHSQGEPGHSTTRRGTT